MKTFFSLSAILLFAISVLAQESPSPLLLIYDASGSMWQKLGDETKKELAADALSATVSALPTDQAIALMAYGHREKDNCDDVEWLLGLENMFADKVVEAVRSLTPTGKTPLSRSAKMALAQLKAQAQTATLILITDGIESCDGNLCQTIADARMDGIDFKLHIVGFGIKEEAADLQCAADAGGGQYFDASDVDKLAAALQQATQTTVDKASENLSIFAIKNGQPVDAWIKVYPANGDKAVAGGRTYRDTAFLEVPNGRFIVDVRPLENTDIKGTSFEIAFSAEEHLHRTISFDGAKIEMEITVNGEPTDGIAKVYSTDFGRPVANARTYGGTKSIEVDPGTYHITFEGLKVNGAGKLDTIKNVTLAGGASEEMAHNFEVGTLIIGVQTQTGDLIDATVSVVDKRLRKNMAGGRTYKNASSNPRTYDLTPGVYDVRIRTLGEHSGHDDTFEIVIRPGETVRKIVTY